MLSRGHGQVLPRSVGCYSYVRRIGLNELPSTSRYTGWSRLSSDEFERSQRQNAEQRRAFIKRWAEYVRTHDDEEWSRQQNTLIDSQLETANEMARRGDTDPIAFFEVHDGHRTDPDE